MNYQLYPFSQHYLLSGLYDNLANTLQTYGPSYNLVFKPNADQEIRSLLDNLRGQEMQIMQLLADEDIKRRIESATVGKASDKNLLERQGEILTLTASYNTGVMDLNRILREIGDAVNNSARRVSVSINTPYAQNAVLTTPVAYMPRPTGSVTEISPYGISGSFIY